MDAACQESIISKSDLHKFIVNVMVKKGASEEHAIILADSLVDSDYRGHYSHGVKNLGAYCEKLTEKRAYGGGHYSIVSHYSKGNLRNCICTQKPADGDKPISMLYLGMVVGKYCMELAIEKAKEEGIGMVTCRGSNHFGFAGWYAMMATERNLLGFAFSNAPVITAYTGTNTPALGTNPISFAAPGRNGEDFVLDMATSVVAHGKTTMQQIKGEEMLKGWALDEDGKKKSIGLDSRHILNKSSPKDNNGKEKHENEEITLATFIRSL